MMTKFQLSAAALVFGLATAADAGPPIRIGIGLGFGGPYYYRPYGYPYYYGYPYGYPYAVPGPVVYQTPPVVLQSGTVVGTTPAPSYSPPPFNAPDPVPVNPNAQNALEFHLGRLNNPDEA